jgi:ABC-type bacteriocin/lantibiotic exporter with double-glycine peptidase domain
LTGVRIGIILQSISAVIVGLVIGFIESWKLTLVVLCFSPVMLLTYKMRARDQVPTGPKAKESFVEQAGQVISKFYYNYECFCL